MQTSIILYIILGAFLSALIAYFQYFFKEKKKTKNQYLLFILRFLSIFLLIILLINPKIQSIQLENLKPTLAILVDGSKSISFFEDDKNIENFVYELKNNQQLNEKFTVKEFIFGDELNDLDSFAFQQKNTNISKAIVTTNELYKNDIAPVVILTDGNQTIGTDYEFIESKQKIFPVVFGDTTKYRDIKISQLNVNKYSYINNKFPVEILLNYEGRIPVTSKLSIFKNNSIVYSKNIQFSAENNSKTITTNLTSNKEGIHFYTAVIEHIADEQNIQNNSKNFSVEVINEQTKILIISSVLHPDIGALKKAIESNKQRSVDYCQIDNLKNKINDYQLVVIFNVNNKFNTILSQLKKEKRNFFLISGTKTNWNFLNKQDLGFTKNAISKTENYAPVFNSSFLTFTQKDIGFDNFPPLTDLFGEVIISKKHQVLLTQNINGLKTAQPLLFTSEINGQKTGVLLGEGIWKWRANSFLQTNSFQEFDAFIGNLIQYLASTKKRNRLDVRLENLYEANATINISAFYTDKNYKFDDRASLEILITNEASKEVFTFPFSLVNNSYQVAVENLLSGNYSYSVSVLGQNISKKGTFKITDYEIETQFTRANHLKLEKLAKNANGKLFYKNQSDKIIKELLADESFYTIQKEISKDETLLDWKWILLIIASLLTSEWFIRKYYGKI